MAQTPKLELLVIANRYPGGKQYGGEFIHVRSKYYLNKINFAVVDMRPSINGVLETAHEGVRVIRSPFQHLSAILKSNPAKAIVIHSPSQATFELVQRFYKNNQIITIHHGSESLDLEKRYSFMKSDLSEKDWAYLQRSQKRKLSFIKDLTASADITKIFVSNYLAQACSEDTKSKLKNFKIIHNGVAEDFFLNQQQIESKRKERKILILRDFSSTHAADIAISIVNRLAQRSDFNEYKISILGFGIHWSAWTCPVAGYKNTTLREGYVTQDLVPGIMHSHDILLVPTRHDTQGLLMCEGMASGMLCVTNRSTGIPEFISDKEGVLSNSDSPAAICEQMYHVINNSEEYLQRRILAMQRARSQFSPKSTAQMELELFSERF